MSFVPEDCMTSFVFHPHLYLLQKFQFILSSLVPQTHICSLSSTNSPLFTHFPHADTRGLRASLNVQVVMTTMSAALNATLRV